MFMVSLMSGIKSRTHRALVLKLYLYGVYAVYS